MSWPLSKVGTRVGELMFQYLPPHNVGIPSCSGYQNTHTHLIVGAYYSSRKRHRSTIFVVKLLYVRFLGPYILL